MDAEDRKCIQSDIDNYRKLIKDCGALNVGLELVRERSHALEHVNREHCQHILDEMTLRILHFIDTELPEMSGCIDCEQTKAIALQLAQEVILWGIRTDSREEAAKN